MSDLKHIFCSLTLLLYDRIFGARGVLRTATQLLSLLLNGVRFGEMGRVNASILLSSTALFFNLKKAHFTLILKHTKRLGLS